jgi:spore coat protein CotH
MKKIVCLLFLLHVVLPAAVLFGAENSKMYIRGTFNKWQCKEMERIDDNKWAAEVDFSGNIDARFKFDSNCDWQDGSYGDTDRDGVASLKNEDIPAYIYNKMKIIFNEKTLAYAFEDYKIIPEYEALFNYKNFEKGKLQTIKIIMPEEEWNNISSDITKHQEKFDNMKTGVYRKANFQYTGPAGDVTLAEVGFRTRGNTSRRSPQDIDGNPVRACFKIKFKETFDLKKGTPEYQKRKTRKFAGLRTLNLRWNTNDDNTMIKELYSYNAFNKIGVYTSRISPVRLIIKAGSKEMDYGIYQIIEPIDKDFLKKRFGGKHNDGNLYKQSYLSDLNTIPDSEIEKKIGVKDVKDWRYDSASKKDFRPIYALGTNKDLNDNSMLLNFIKNINMLSGAALKNYLEKHFEVDRFLRYQALGILIGSPDDYWSNGNNYYLYFDNKGKISFLPIDYDNALGQNWVPFDIVGSSIYTYGHPLNGNQHPVLINKIFSIPEYKTAYTEYVKTYLAPENRVFTWSEYDKMFHEQ